MDVDKSTATFVNSISDGTSKGLLDINYEITIEKYEEQKDCTEKQSAKWSSSATSTLLKLYESKLEMLETPKRKKKIWLAISESLKDHNIDVSSDQVRWKINALTRKYKRCVETGVHNKFRYFKQMDHICSKYNIDGYGYTTSKILDTKNSVHRNKTSISMASESKAIIELRKIRLSNRIEADRSQAKIHKEKQWLEYLNREEQRTMLRDHILERSLQIKEEEIKLRKTRLESIQSLEMKYMHLQEKDLDELLQIQKEKYDLLTQIYQ